MEEMNVRGQAGKGILTHQYWNIKSKDFVFIFMFNFIVAVISLTTVSYPHLVEYSGNAEKGKTAGFLN